MASVSQEWKMLAVAQETVRQAETAKTAVIMIAIVVVAFWKVLLRLLVALIAIAFVVLVGAGVVLLAQR
jgi:hypothetical protein